MASKRIFKSLAQNIAHHSDSYLSYLHPSLGEACKAAGTETITLELLGGPILPSNVPTSKELENAIPAWRDRFKEMADKQGLDISQLQKASVKFDYSAYKDLYSVDTSAELVHSDGTVYTATGWRPEEPIDPQKRIPGTDLLWPKGRP